MSNEKDWRTANVTAVSSATSLVTSSSAAGFQGVAGASLVVTNLIVNNFNFAPSPESVSDQDYAHLEAQVRALEAQIEATNRSRTEAFKCKEDFERSWPAASTKPAKFNCMAAYLACLAQGFKITFKL